MAKTAASITAKYLRGVQQGGPAFLEGVRAVDVNPADKAIAAKDLYVMRLQESIAEGRWEAGLSQVTLPSWKAATEAGQAKYVQSAQVGSAKFGDFVNQAMPVWEQARATIAQMPKGTESDAMARIQENMRIMKTLKGRRAGRRR